MTRFAGSERRTGNNKGDSRFLRYGGKCAAFGRNDEVG
jgi:hypothetical protein